MPAARSHPWMWALIRRADGAITSGPGEQVLHGHQSTEPASIAALGQTWCFQGLMTIMQGCHALVWLEILCMLNLGNLCRNELGCIQKFRRNAEGAEVGASVQHHLCHLDGYRIDRGQPVVRDDAGKIASPNLFPHFDSLAFFAMDFRLSHAGSFVAFIALSI